MPAVRWPGRGRAGATFAKARRSPQRTADEVEDEIVALRKELTNLGVDAGAQTIRVHLARCRGEDRVPSVSTTRRILVRRGFVTPQPRKRPRSSYVRFEAAMPNERWQADITHWRLADGTEVEILNAIDDHSRLLVASDARVIFKAADVVGSFRAAAAAHGIPGVAPDGQRCGVFTAAPRGGRCALELECARAGIRLVHSSPYHPQACGKVERLHQTLKRFLAKQDPARTIGELQGQLDTFRAYYNTVRPHRAIGRATPAEAFAARPKATPSLRPLPVPGRFRLRRDKVDQTGVVTLRHDSRLHHIAIGRGFVGTRVLLLVDHLQVRVITEDGEVLRSFTLDPTRDYQSRSLDER